MQQRIVETIPTPLNPKPLQQRIVETIFDTWHRYFSLMTIHASKFVYNFFRRTKKSGEVTLVVSQRPD